jgi:hypothetical protein
MLTSSSTKKNHVCNHEYLISTKINIQTVVAFNDAKKFPYFESDLFDFFEVNHRFDWRMLKTKSFRRVHHQKKSENRDKKKLINSKIVQRMQKIIKNDEIQTHVIIWHQLIVVVDLIDRSHVHFSIVRTIMQNLKYHKCLICSKFWIALNLRMKRRTFANSQFD